MDLMLQPVRKYADFNGRARRSEYWLFQLFIWGVIIGLYAISAILSVLLIQPAAVGPDATVRPDDPVVTAAAVASMAVFGVLVLFFLAMIIPNLAVRIRRLHDIGVTGWLVLIALIPGVGWIVLLIMSMLDGSYGPNSYGPDPKGRGKSSVADNFV